MTSYISKLLVSASTQSLSHDKGKTRKTCLKFDADKKWCMKLRIQIRRKNVSI